MIPQGKLEAVRNPMLKRDHPATHPMQRVARWYHTLAWRLIIPIPLALVVAIALAWFVVPKVIAENASSEAILAGQQTAAQFKLIRAYYTQNVVNKVTKF